MSLRRSLSTAVLAVGGILASDAMLRQLAGVPTSPVPGSSETVRVRGLDVAVTTTGPEDAPTVVLVHDLYPGASSWEFHPLAEELREDYQLVLIDLPGWGRSDRPAIQYNPQLMTDAIATAMTETTEQPTVLLSGLAASYGLPACAQTDPDRVICIAPGDHYQASNAAKSLAYAMPVLGRATYNAQMSKALLRRVLQAQYELPAGALEDALLEAAWTNAHQPGSRTVTRQLYAGHFDAIRRLSTAIEAVDAPTQLVTGAEAETPSVHETRVLAARTDAPLSIVDGVGSAPHIAQPTAVATHLKEAVLPTP